MRVPVFALFYLLKKQGMLQYFILVMVEVKKTQLVHLALLTAGILLILTEYELYEKQKKANLAIGRQLTCNHEVPV